MIHAISAGLGVALVPEQLKKLPHKNVVFRPVKPAVATEACVAWKGENPSAPLKTYVEIVEHVGRNIRCSTEWPLCISLGRVSYSGVPIAWAICYHKLGTIRNSTR